MPNFVTVRLRTDTRKKLDRVKQTFSDRRKMTLAEAADMAADSLDLLTKDQLVALVERRPESPKRIKASA